MGNPIQLRRGTTAERTAVTPDSGEPVWDTTLKQVFVGDGTTAGGNAVDAVASAALAVHIANVANPHVVTKTQVGLSNVDNTSDVNKPVSTAQAAADALKANLTGAAFTGAVSTTSTFAAAGKVGIGGASNVSGLTFSGGLGLHTGTAGTSSNGGIRLYESGNDIYSIAGNSTTGGLEIAANQVGQGIRFYCGAVNTAPAEAMRITGDRALLIGGTTDNGLDRLQVTGSGKFTQTGGPIIATLDNGNVNANATLLEFQQQGSSFWRIGVPNASDAFAIYGYGAGAYPEYLRVSSAGRLLIGTAVDRGADMLQVNGSIEIENQINCYTGGDLEIVQRAGGNILMYTGSSALRATLSVTGLAVVGAGTFSTGFGCNGAAAQTAVAVNAACTDLATAVALINQLRAALIANGICV